MAAQWVQQYEDRLGQVTPTAPRGDVTDDRGGHAMLGGEYGVGDAALGIAGTDSDDLRGGQFGASLRLTPRNAGASSPLRPHVIRVVDAGAKRQVVGVDTRRHIADVTNHQVFGDGAIDQFPRVAVSADTFAGAHVEDAVTKCGRAALPQPAARGLLDLAPEPTIQWRSRPTRVKTLPTTEPTTPLLDPRRIAQKRLATRHAHALDSHLVDKSTTSRIGELV